MTPTDEDRAFLDAWDAERYTRRRPVPSSSGRPERTGQRCIVCYADEYAGQPIAHRPGCADYRRPPVRNVNADIPTQPGYRTVWATGSEAYATVVSRLVERRRGRYDCPACGARGDGHGVKVDLVNGAVLVQCFTCRAPQEIVDALGMTPADLGWRRAA